MKKFSKIYFPVLIILLFSFISQIKAQSGLKKVAQSGMEYLKIGVGAEMVGRGEAGISSVKGLQSIFWNPAGLSDLEDKEVFFSHNSWIADISMDAAAVGMNFGNYGNFAVSVMWMNYGKLYATAVANTVSGSTKLGYIDEGTFSPTDMAVGLAYSRRISDRFAVGGQIRYLYENYGQNVIVTTTGGNQTVDNIMKTFSLDLGTVYYPGYKSLAFAMSIQNFSPDIRYQQESFGTPLTFKLGISMNMLDIFEDNPSSSLLLAVDAIHPRDYTERLNLGLEYSYLGIFQIRTGYRMNYDIGNFTSGVGLRYSLSNSMQINLNLSYIVDATGRFSNPIQITAALQF